MRTIFSRFLPVIVAMLLAASLAHAAQVVSTTARGVPAVMQADGFMLQPAGVAPASYDDLAPQQLFEIIRPGNQPITIGRMFTSCTCVRLEADSRSFGPGERAVVRLKNIQPTPPGGMSYAVYVQITSPIQATLRYDTYVQSSQFVPAPDGFQPTRGNIISDGVLTEPVYSAVAGSADFTAAASTVPVSIYAGSDIEMIVPKAENYQPDTSEYTLRKRAEEEAAVDEKTISSAGKDAAESGVLPAADGDKAVAARPRMDEKTRAEINAAIDKVEETVARSGRVVADSATPSLDNVADRARSEAETAARLTVEQGKALREEAKKIGEDILSGETKTAKAASDGAKAAGTSATTTAADKTPAVADKVAAKGDSLWKEVGRKATSAEEKVESALQAADEKTTLAATQSGEAVKSAARSIAQDAAKIENKAGEALQSAVNAASEAVDKVESVGKSAADAVKAAIND